MNEPKEITDSSSDWLISKVDHSTHDPNVGFIEAFYQTCSTALVYLWKKRFRLMSHGPQKDTLKKDVANIRLWEDNFSPGHLDNILGQAGYLKTSVVENLKGIGDILSLYLTSYLGTTATSQSESDAPGDLTHDLEIQLEKAAILILAEETDLSSDDEASDDSSSTAEREQNRLGRLHCYVRCLMDLAPAIENHVYRLQFQVEAPPTPLDNFFSLPQSAQPFAMRIRDRFNNAPTPLVERLAEANWERRIRITAQEPPEGNEAHPILFKPGSVFHDSGIGTTIPYAATAASHTSFLSVAGEEALGRARVPPLPRESGRPFQCEYCQKTISMRSRIDWKLHVYADLQSYICTHSECGDALKTFPTRKLWADHEFNRHFTSTQWRCFTCNITTATQQLFVDHLMNKHDKTHSKYPLWAGISEAKETVLNPEFKHHKCALCLRTGWQTRKEYATHMGQHLEEISLACLTRHGDNDSDADVKTDTSSKSNTPGSANNVLEWYDPDDHPRSPGLEISAVEYVYNDTPTQQASHDSHGTKTSILDTKPGEGTVGITPELQISDLTGAEHVARKRTDPLAEHRIQEGPHLDNLTLPPLHGPQEGHLPRLQIHEMEPITLEPITSGQNNFELTGQRSISTNPIIHKIHHNSSKNYAGE